MTAIYFVTGSKGGAGATTCAVNLGYALAAAGERTLVVDGDCECAGALETCGLQGLNVYTLADAAKGACRVKQAILAHPDRPNFYILPSLGCDDDGFACEAVKQCSNLFDVVICDGIAEGACTAALLISDAYPATLTHAKNRAARLRDKGFKDCRLLINRLNGGLLFDGAVLTPQETASLTGCALLGVIPEDLSLPLGKIKAGTKKAFALAADSLTGKGDRIYKVIRPYLGLTGIIKRKMRDFI